MAYSIRIMMDDATARRMRAISREKDRSIEDLAETAVAETALSYFRNRKDDPA